MLNRYLEPLREKAYALLRIVAGLMFSFHGMQKLFGIFGASQPSVGSQIWIGGIIEMVTGLAIAFGAFTPYAALVASGTMAVAYVQFHWKLSFDQNLLPKVNKGELALLYSVLFLFVACRGGGAYSADELQRRRNR